MTNRLNYFDGLALRVIIAEGCPVWIRRETFSTAVSQKSLALRAHFHLMAERQAAQATGLWRRSGVIVEHARPCVSIVDPCVGERPLCRAQRPWRKNPPITPHSPTPLPSCTRVLKCVMLGSVVVC